MRRVLLAAAAASVLAACGRARPAPGTPVEYRAPDGAFSARVPAGWKVDDAPADEPGADFYGPPDGPDPFSQSMGISFHPARAAEQDARAFVAARSAAGPSAPADALDGTRDRVIPDVHLGSRRVTTRTVAVVVPGGFYALSHDWPTGTAPSPAFDALVKSFRPGPAPKP